MSRKILAGVSVVAACLAAPAVAGPEWVEGVGMDAGSLPGGAQVTYGEIPIQFINGCLGGLGCFGVVNGEGDDFQDMFLIRISDPQNFSATTLGLGNAGFDTTLYLFDTDGLGLLGNDDTPVVVLDGPVQSGSTLGNFSNDGTGVVITEPGLYLLTITVSPHIPLDVNGNPLFIFAGKGETSGPEGNAGAITEWVEATGACCMYNGDSGDSGATGISCEALTEAQCEQTGGVYLGDAVACDGGEACPLTTGACCLPDIGVNGFVCKKLPAGACAKAGGMYIGDDVRCDGGEACPTPTGACCYNELDFDACEVLTQDECASFSGEYLGDGTDCDPEGACPLPTGACCLNGRSCYELAEVECLDLEGTYYGDGVPCGGKGTCPEAVGACCITGDKGNYCLMLTAYECSLEEGHYYGDDVICADAGACPQGACCVGYLDPEPVCYEAMDIAECETLGGTFLGADSFCGPKGTCPLGGCCLDGKQFCAWVTSEECTELNGSFSGSGTSCWACTALTGSTGPTDGMYLIHLGGVMASTTDCDNNSEPDSVQTEPEFDPQNIEANAQDLCEDAEWLCPGGYAGSSAGALPGDLLTCGLYFGGYDVFYRYRPKYNGLAFVSVAGPPSSWLVSVHTACPATNANRVACSSTTPGVVTFQAQRGQTYWIRTAAVNFATGPFTISLVGPDCAPNAEDFDGNGLPDVCECPTDVAPAPKGDGMTNLLDFVAAVAAVGPCAGCPEDVDMSGVVDATDLQLILIELNEPCPDANPDPLANLPGETR